jgi:hypothetical protein
MSGYPLSPAAAAVLPSSETVAGLPSVAEEGALSWVIKRGRFFQRLGGDWVSRPETSDPAWASASLAISSSGDDDAPGTSGAPIRTLAEWRERTSRLAIGQATLTLLDSLTAETDITLGGACDADLDRWLYVTAAPAVLLSTTLSAVTPWALDASTNTVGTVTGTASLVAYAGAAGLAGKLWRIVGGARGGACGVLGRSEGAGALVFVPPISALYAVDTVTPQAGDTIEVLEPLTLAERLRVGVGCNVFLDGVALGIGGNHDVQVPAGSKLWASGCAFSGGIDALQAGAVELTGCALDGSVRAEGDGAGGSSRIEVRGCHARALEVRGGGVAIFSDIVTTYQMTLEAMSSALVASGFVFFDSLASTALSLGKRSLLDAAGVLNGRGTTGTPARVVAGKGAMLAYSAKPNIAGTGSEWSANGSTGNFSALPVSGGVDGTFIVAR